MADAVKLLIGGTEPAKVPSQANDAFERIRVDQQQPLIFRFPSKSSFRQGAVAHSVLVTAITIFAAVGTYYFTVYHWGHRILARLVGLIMQ
jgi:hypothetical protein